MKLVRLDYSAENLRRANGFWNMCLETKEDIEKYILLESKKSAKAFWQMWKDTKDYLNKMDHCIPRNNAPVQVTAFKIMRQASEYGEVSLVEACTINDMVMLERKQLMMKLLSNGYSIRVNKAGGMSNIDSFFTILEEREVTGDDLYKWLFHQSDDFEKREADLSFTKSCLVFENDNIISEELSTIISSSWSSKNVEIIVKFKELLACYKDEEIFTSFFKWVNNSFSPTIYLETTFIDKNQFSKVKKLIESVMKEIGKVALSKTLHVNILSNDKSFDVKTNMKNIKINIL